MLRLRSILLVFVLPVLLLTACQVERNDRSQNDRVTEVDVERSRNDVVMLGRYERRATEEDIERARRDTTWRQYRARDTRQRTADPGSPQSERAAQSEPAARSLDSTAVDRYAEALALPLAEDGDSLEVLYAQVLLDRAGFSPGQIDNRWGQNTEKAIYWLQRREELDATGTLDRETLDRLARLAGAPDRPERLVVTYTLTTDDVEGPFEPVPDDIYEQAEKDRLGYASLAEKLGERFHSSPAVLRQLNDGRSLDGLTAGDTIRVPDVRSGTPPGARDVSRIVISDGGRYLHALGSDGRIVYHFPATLGAEYDPSPSETLEITGVTHEPGWHYQPSILADVDDEEEEAHIPPGPNNAVGTVWMNLSKEHYGIHGTAEPGTIGYATSSGCVRLTNWDATFLAEQISPGIQVEFVDVDWRGSSGEAAQTASAAP